MENVSKQSFANRMVLFLLKSGLYFPLKVALHKIILYHPRYLRFFKPFIPDGSLCFDIGADVGWWSSLFRKAGGRVIAAEPQAASLRRLERKFRHDPHVTIVPVALGAMEGKAPMLISNAPPLSSFSSEWIQRASQSQRFRDFHWHDSREVAMTTLDRLIAAYGIPSVIKIDVEGYEAEVLKGLSWSVDCLIFEFNAEYLQPALEAVDLLASLADYRFNISLGQSCRFLLDYWVKAPEVSQTLLSLADRRLYGEILACNNYQSPL